MRIKFILLMLQCVISCYLSHARRLSDATYQPDDFCHLPHSAIQTVIQTKQPQLNEHNLNNSWHSSVALEKDINQTKQPQPSGCSLKEGSRPTVARELENRSSQLFAGTSANQPERPQPSGCSLKEGSRPSVKLELEDLVQVFELTQQDRVG